MADEAVRSADVAVAVNGGAEETKSASESSSFASFNRGGEGSAGLSPPQTWTDSSDGDDSRHSDEDERAGKTLVNERETSPDELFVLHVEVPNGRVKQSQLLNATIISAQSIEVGGSLFSVLVGSAQSFFLSAALSSSRRQRLFARVRCNGGGTVACELLCDFSDVEAECRVTARLLHSAFSARRPFATPVAFCTRHAPNCALTHIDHVAIPYLGHLPTDLVGKSILSFVHAADLHVVVQAHVDLLASRGRVVRSASALRLVAHNGAILHATVEWSGFLNPWTRKLELVVARHQLCGAPIGDADVLAEPRTDGSRPLPLASASVVKRVENEIRQLLSTSVPSSTRVHKTVEQAAPTDLGAYIDRLVESLVTNTAAVNANGQVNAVQSPEAMSAPSVLPLTYSQINCLENVHRLLKSQARAAETAGDLRESLPCREPPVLPLTRELLMQHTKKWEERYKDTWKKRLSQKRTVPEGSPIIAKRPRNDYNTMRPSPVPPPGQNFQITSVPLPPRPGSSEAPRPPPQPQAAWDASAENCAVRLLCLAARARAGFELLAAQQPLPQPPQPSVLPEVV